MLPQGPGNCCKYWLALRIDFLNMILLRSSGAIKSYDLWLLLEISLFRLRQCVAIVLVLLCVALKSYCLLTLWSVLVQNGLCTTRMWGRQFGITFWISCYFCLGKFPSLWSSGIGFRVIWSLEKFVGWLWLRHLWPAIKEK